MKRRNLASLLLSVVLGLLAINGFSHESAHSIARIEDDCAPLYEINASAFSFFGGGLLPTVAAAPENAPVSFHRLLFHAEGKTIAAEGNLYSTYPLRRPFSANNFALPIYLANRTLLI